MGKNKKEQKPVKLNRRQLKHKELDEEIGNLLERIKEPITDLESNMFDVLPLSKNTLEGLKGANFLEMTEIQQKSIPLALSNKDILAAAKTGSGKTLAFLIPLLEKLYVNRWGSQDGLGALVISPTRELAVQIFRVLCKIGKKHSFSAGLVIGGKDVKMEKERIGKMNILIGTPGRLLQHMDETHTFEADNLQMLVLDEADRIMDMGFSKTVNSILEFLPNNRQTLLFSATQTKSVKDLSRLSLVEPEYVGVYEKSEFATPVGLSQHYMKISLDKKLDTLYSFIKTHLKTKCIVFMSSCKQVRFIFETFCKLQPGVPLLHLHGKQKQSKRVDIFEKFTAHSEAYLFCTDIAARGLDFPSVNWVLQLDCPEDIQTYIHRVGRTARYESKGNALLFLNPSEEDGFIKHLDKFQIPINKVEPQKSQLKAITSQLQSFCFKDPEIKYLGQRAFVSYLKSIYLQKDKSVFDVHTLPAELFAQSLGLPGTPQIKFMKKLNQKTAADQLKAKSDEGYGSADSKSNELTTTTDKKQPLTKVERLFAKKNRTVLADHYTKLVDHEQLSDDDEEDFMTVKRVNHEIEDLDDNLNKEEIEALSKRQLQRIKEKSLKNQSKNEKLIFDEEGNAHAIYELEDGTQFLKDEDVKIIQNQYFDEERKKFTVEDKLDKNLAKEKKKLKKLNKKINMNSEDQEEAIYTLGSNSEAELSDANNDSHSEPDSDSDNNDESEEDEEDITIVDYRRNKRLSTFNSLDTKTASSLKKTKVLQVNQPLTLQDEEALALQLLEK